MPPRLPVRARGISTRALVRAMVVVGLLAIVYQTNSYGRSGRGAPTTMPVESFRSAEDGENTRQTVAPLHDEENGDPTGSPAGTSSSSHQQESDHQPTRAESTLPPLWAENLNPAEAVVRGTRELEDALLVRQAEGSNALRACFVTLIRHDTQSINKFQKLLASVVQHLPSMARKYPWVAFHEQAGNPNQIAKELLLAAMPEDKRPQLWPAVNGPALPWAELVARYVYPAGVRFGSLTLDDFGRIPNWVVDNSVRRWFYGPEMHYSVNYRHMCRFFAVRLFYLQALKHFDYYIRFDTDSYVLTQPLAPSPPYVRAARQVVEKYGATDLGHPRAREINVLAQNDAKGPFGIPNHTTTSVFGLSHSPLPGRGTALRTPPRKSGNNAAQGHKARARANAKSPFRSRGQRPQAVQDYDHSEEHEENENAVKDLDLFLHFLASDPPPRGEKITSETDPSKGVGTFHLYWERQYGFSMIHPQTQPIFLTQLWESFDSFLSEENRGRPQADSAFLRPKSLFNAPRGSMLHYWDNFELVDLRMFRSAKHRELFPVAHPEELRGDPSASDLAAEYDRMVKKENELTKEYQRQLMSKVYDALAVQNQPQSKQWEKDQVLKEASKQMKATTAQVDEEHNKRSQQISRFLEYFDRKGGFYYYRWGDAELRTLLVSLFVPPKGIVYLSSFPYQHYHNYHCPSATKGSDETHRRIAHEVEARCLEAAKRGMGSGGKRVGEAPMNPAEKAHLNELLAKQARNDGGWFNI